MKKNQKRGLIILIVGLIIILLSLWGESLVKWNWGSLASLPVVFFLVIGSILMIIGLVFLMGSTLRKEIEYPFDKEQDWKSVAGRIGPVLILIEGIFFIIEGVIGIFLGGTINYFVLMGGLVAILGIYLGYKRNRYARTICFIAGTLALVSLILTFLPWTMYYVYFILLYYMFYFGYLLLILFFIGGILCLISGDRFLNYYLDISDFRHSAKKNRQ